MALDAAVDSPSSELSSHHSADISDHTKMSIVFIVLSTIIKESAILTVRCHLISVLEVTKLSYFIFLFQVLPLFSLTSANCHIALQVLLHHRRSAAKAQEIKNKKSAVITLFEITIIKITYNLRFKDV